MEKFRDILNIARDNVRKNPIVVDVSTKEILERYLKGLMDEVSEVRVEVKENNEVYLTDELSDIVWDYAVVLALAEQRGLIKSADQVLEHGFQKYSERAPAFIEADQEMWESVKAKQKANLQQRHEELYGN